MTFKRAEKHQGHRWHPNSLRWLIQLISLHVQNVPASFCPTPVDDGVTRLNETSADLRLIIFLRGNAIFYSCDSPSPNRCHLMPGGALLPDPDWSKQQQQQQQPQQQQQQQQNDLETAQLAGLPWKALKQNTFSCSWLTPVSAMIVEKSAWYNDLKYGTFLQRLRILVLLLTLIMKILGVELVVRNTVPDRSVSFLFVLAESFKLNQRKNCQNC